MSSYPVRKGGCTFEEFLDLVPDGQKADLLDGVIYMASPDNTDANELSVWLSSILSNYVEMNDLGKIYAERVAYRIGPKRGPEPDIGFVPKKLESMRQRGFIDGPPALAVEIVSPDSVGRDYIQKRKIYEEAGVQEYWIIDPDEKQATFLRLRRGKYEKVKPVRHIFKSAVLPGFEIDECWLCSADRPRAYDVLQRLLGENEGSKRAVRSTPKSSRRRS